MQRERKRRATEGGYTYVSDELRQILLDMIKENPDLTLKEAARSLGIKYSTAKTIKRVYLTEKRSTKKPNPRRSKTKKKKIAQRKKIFLVHHLTNTSTYFDNQKESEAREEEFVKRKEKNLLRSLSKKQKIFKVKSKKSKTVAPLPQEKIYEKPKEITERESICIRDIYEFYELHVKKRSLELEISRNDFHLSQIDLILRYYYSKRLDPGVVGNPYSSLIQ